MMKGRKPITLSPREAECLLLVGEGCTSQEIADRIARSKRTVDFHLANIYSKLQVNNRVEAFRSALRMGLIPFPDQVKF